MLSQEVNALAPAGVFCFVWRRLQVKIVFTLAVLPFLKGGAHCGSISTNRVISWPIVESGI